MCIYACVNMAILMYVLKYIWDKQRLLSEYCQTLMLPIWMSCTVRWKKWMHWAHKHVWISFMACVNKHLICKIFCLTCLVTRGKDTHTHACHCFPISDVMHPTQLWFFNLNICCFFLNQQSKKHWISGIPPHYCQ